MAHKELPTTGAELHTALGNTSVLTEQECAWLLMARSGDVAGVLAGVLPTAILLEDVKQDRERRYPSYGDCSGLYPGYE